MSTYDKSGKIAKAESDKTGESWREKEDEDNGFVQPRPKGRARCFDNDRNTRGRGGHRNGNTRGRGGHRNGNTRSNTRGRGGHHNGDSRSDNRQNNNYQKKKEDNLGWTINEICSTMIESHMAKFGVPPSNGEIKEIMEAALHELCYPSNTSEIDEHELAYRKGLQGTISHQDIEKIDATVLNMIVSEITYFAIINAKYDIYTYVVEEFGPHIACTSDSVNHVVKKSAKGFLVMNEIFWNKKVGALIGKDGATDELIIEKMLDMIRAFRHLKINPMERNAKHETTLDSYKAGHKKGRAPWSTEILIALQFGDMSSLIRSIINMIAPDMSDSLRTKFKNAYTYGLDSLCRGLVINILASYVYAKQRGVHARVTEYVHMATEFLKVKPTEYVDEEYEYSDEVVRKFLHALASNALLILATEAQTPDPGDLRQWATDVIGGMIGEISVMLDSPDIFAVFFDSQYALVEPGTDAENQMLTLIAHMSDRLETTRQAWKVKNFLTPKICYDLQTLIAKGKFSRRIKMLIEGRIASLMSMKTIDLQKVGDCIHHDMAQFIEIHEMEQAEALAEAEAEAEAEAAVDADGNNVRAWERVTGVVELGYTENAGFVAYGLPKFVPVPDVDYLTAQGYRILANALARGFNTTFPFTEMKIELQRQTICNIIYNAADQVGQFHTVEDVEEAGEGTDLIDDVANAIEGIKLILEAHCGTDLVAESLRNFAADIRLLNDETRSYLWDSRNGKENFDRFCVAFGVSD